MTYAIVSCGKCKRQRMIDRSATSSKCPYCSTSAEHKGLAVIFEDKDQNVVRDVLTGMHPFDVPEKKRSKIDHDPLSTLIYKYEHASDLEEKMELLSKGLTKIYDTFTIADVEKIDEKNAEKMLKAMSERGYVHEVKYGRYRA
ncbi:hypothetical protein Mpt1_c08910 [Candidatus Methanoplasma termitum]|uniref:DUF1922 domain-containing protein n=1 Tax=Candidatus Methanoplasma termitum TaxID=1577791 RepID=A0A0A7LEL7_9ARCH|nr:hypothetical protein [Candidatus Methanoplasma termitum]AIZ56767.1 hypothetical protein Mpt1_c08910 [Candidatus Methanoplasma termitum]MCL2333621.1 hypothetical protein [Candidatus Methanoplasma sp.]